MSPVKNYFYLLLVSLIFGSGFGSFQEPEKPRTVRRVKRPQYTDQSDLPYFDNVFEEGLKGKRPVPKSVRILSETKRSEVESEIRNEGQRWSKFVSRDAIEDEVKRIQQQLKIELKSQSQFDSRFGLIRRKFGMLSMLFAVIRQYDQEIRWKKYAATAQFLFAQAAIKARQPSKPGFQFAKNRLIDLEGLVRGGGIPVDENTTAGLQWPDVIERDIAMARLQVSLREVLKPATSNESTFHAVKSDLIREANLVSALASVLIQKDMDEADDDGYVGYSESMGVAARNLVLAAENNEFDQVSLSIRNIEQSCNNCHDEWR